MLDYLTWLSFLDPARAGWPILGLKHEMRLVTSDRAPTDEEIVNP